MTENNDSTDLFVEQIHEYEIGSMQMDSAYLSTAQFDEIHIQHEDTVFVVEETDGGLELVPEAEKE